MCLSGKIKIINLTKLIIMEDLEGTKKIPKEFAIQKVLYKDRDGWVTPDGEFYFSNWSREKPEETFHDVCAEYVLEHEKDRVWNLARENDKTLNDEDFKELPARMLLQKAGYLLISFGIPQYLNPLTEMQAGLLSDAGYALPPESESELLRKLPDKSAVFKKIDSLEMSNQMRCVVIKETEALFERPERGMFLESSMQGDDYYKLAQEMYRILLESYGKDGETQKAMEGQRYYGIKKMRYVDIGDGIALVFEENTHAINDYDGGIDKVFHDDHIYLQNLKWAEERLKRMEEGSTSYSRGRDLKKL
jgi:hypothetical protein